MSLVRELYRIEGLPIFQNRMYASRADARSCPRGDVILVQDLESGLIFNQVFQPELMEYDEHYQNEQGVSSVFQKHLDAIATLIERTMGRERLVEVGCGKGYFLELLSSKGFDVCGFDPTYEGASDRVLREYFHPGLGIRGDGLILRHVLEHIRDPVEFLKRLRDANGRAGKIYIEVPCFDWIMNHHAWFDIFYEHVNYFRLSDFERIFDRVFEAKRTFGGQYLSVVADLATVRDPKWDGAEPVTLPEGFVPNPRQYDLRHAAVWGGASKGVLFSLIMERAGVDVGVVIDINPAKQGRYLPATGIRILSPNEGMRLLPDGAAVYVMNCNYLPEVRDMTGNRYRYIGIDNE